MPEAKNPKAVNSELNDFSERFTDRKSEQERFDNFLSNSNYNPLIMIYGVPGSGKTWLLRKYEENCISKNIDYARVDLAFAKSAEQVLPRLASNLLKNTGIKFPNFQRALSALTYRGTGISNTLEKISQEEINSKMGNIGIEALELVPILDKFVKAGKLVYSASDLAIDQILEPYEWQLFNMSENDLRTEVLRTFALDLMEAKKTIVLFFDRHDKLWRDDFGGHTHNDEWLKELKQYMHKEKIVLVVSGRNKLDWGKDWEQTDELKNKWLDQYCLNGFSEIDAKDYLNRVVPAIPSNLITAILSLAEEENKKNANTTYYCLLLQLCADILVNFKEKSDKYPEAIYFSEIPSNAVLEQLTERFLDTLPNQAMIDWIKDLCLTPYFDESLALELAQKGYHQVGKSDFNYIRGLSLVQENEKNLLEFHRVFKKTLEQKSLNQDLDSKHKLLSEIWQNRIDNKYGLNSNLYWYHLRFFDYRKAIEYFDELHSNSRFNSDSFEIENLIAWWDLVELKERPNTDPSAEDLFKLGALLTDSKSIDLGKRIQDAYELFFKAAEYYNENNRSTEWAHCKKGMGTALIELPTGDKSKNLLEAIKHYESALEVFSKTSNREEWAKIQNSLGYIYTELPYGDKESNLRTALEYFNKSLSVHSQKDFPIEWARRNANIGRVYSELPTNVDQERAIELYQDSLEILTKEEYPMDWIQIMMNLSAAYLKRGGKEKKKNVDDSINCSQCALSIATKKNLPIEWSRLQGNLANALTEIPTKENFVEASNCYDNIFNVIKQDAFPREWARTKLNQATYYTKLPFGDKNVNLRKAIDCLKESLLVYKFNQYPERWAVIQMNLGSIYSQLSDDHPIQSKQSSFNHLKEALSYFSEDKYPEHWYECMNTLGSNYSSPHSHSGKPSYLKAEACYRKALRILDEEKHSIKRGKLLFNIGNVYAKCKREPLTQNLQKSIELYKESLENFNRKDCPYEWASNNLAIARSILDLSKIDAGIKTSDSIPYFKNALSFFGFNNFREQWALASVHIANAYLLIPNNDQNSDFNSAITYFKDALDYYTEVSFPVDWANINIAISNCFVTITSDCRTSNLKNAIFHYKRIVPFLKTQNDKTPLAMIYQNLANAYFELGILEDKKHFQKYEDYMRLAKLTAPYLPLLQPSDS